MTLYDCKRCEKKFGTDECNCKTLCTKDLEEYKQQIRADVIDELAKKLIQTVTSMTTGFRVVGNIERIAKELKEQNK